MKNKVDHFAIGASDLEQGAAFLVSQCGVTIPRGGKHDAMSTHNCVSQAGNGAFLEIISIDPDAPDPGRARWFSLDDPATQAKLANSPAALCWVVGTDHLDEVVSRSPIDLGEVITFTRGDRSWRLTVPKDGSLPENGLIPSFIEWSPGPHPSENMQDVGLTLESVRITHPDTAGFAELLETLQISHLVHLESSDCRSLSFDLTTANGEAVRIL
ncbi:MAG: VOC family protein [Acidiferrobacterales bacterium]|nr:VOC family protein [Acidiferrobacterales bacterium]